MSNYAPESGSKELPCVTIYTHERGSKEASELRYRTLRNQAKQRERDALQAGLNSVIIALTSTGMGLAAAQAVSGLEKHAGVGAVIGLAVGVLGGTAYYMRRTD